MSTAELAIPDVLPADLEATGREPLLPVDRCDHGGCSAQAYLAVQVIDSTVKVDHPGELLFCGHHYARHEIHLVDKVVRDDREKLLAPLTAAY